MVDDFGTNQKRIYEFLLVINSNFGPILHRFWDTATYWLKIAFFSYPGLWLKVFGTGTVLELAPNGAAFYSLQVSEIQVSWARVTPITAEPGPLRALLGHCSYSHEEYRPSALW